MGRSCPSAPSLFMTTLMDNSMVAQNTCLQMCVIGRNTFIGAGSTFTDFNLLPRPIRAWMETGELSLANRPVLGGCVGHNCRLGSGMIVLPGAHDRIGRGLVCLPRAAGDRPGYALRRQRPPQAALCEPAPAALPAPRGDGRRVLVASRCLFPREGKYPKTRLRWRLGAT